MPKSLSVTEAKRFYDRFGRLQDVQALYEGRALRYLEEAGRFESARAVFEFGCGTGAFARRLFERRLPEGARYVGVDVSETMARIARRRLERWRRRAEIRLVSGSLPFEDADASYDRFLSNYVLDLLPEEEIAAVLAEARRMLTGDGLLCLASLTHGATAASRIIGRLWSRIHDWKPWWTGGCRPIELLEFVKPPQWRVFERRTVSQLGISSEVLIAGKGQPEDAAGTVSVRLLRN